MYSALVCSNNDKWRSRRRLITPSFHDNQLLHNFMDIFNEQAIVLAQRFARLAEQTTTHNLYPYISSCTLDVITGLLRWHVLLLFTFSFLNFVEAATGKKAGAQANDGENDFVQATVRYDYRTDFFIYKLLFKKDEWNNCYSCAITLAMAHIYFRSFVRWTRSEASITNSSWVFTESNIPSFSFAPHATSWSPCCRSSKSVSRRSTKKTV